MFRAFFKFMLNLLSKPSVWIFLFGLVASKDWFWLDQYGPLITAIGTAVADITKTIIFSR